MCSTWMAFAELIDDGTIETWGEGSYGGGADPFSAPPSGDGFVDVVAGFHHFYCNCVKTARLLSGVELSRVHGQVRN